jgi:hypothetical protein
MGLLLYSTQYHAHFVHRMDHWYLRHVDSIELQHET